MVKKLNKNSVALAGEFAVLSQLALRGYDANMTLGHTKSVDILISHPSSGNMCKLEVKTNYRSASGGSSKLFGRFVSIWPMNEKHEKIKDQKLFYCFVNINKDNAGRDIRFFIVPSQIVAEYVKREHKLWLDEKSSHKQTKMRTFRIGTRDGEYRISTPLRQDFENNWNQLIQ